ncbi:MAG: MbnH family di-heme enzyme [Polyangiaceae bacterium]
MPHRTPRLAALVAPLAALVCVACGAGDGSDGDPAPEIVRPTQPKGFPPMAIPANNALSTAKIELGRHLFYDKKLSANETQSCASCHKQELAFTDAKVTSTGSTGHVLERNSQTLTNVGYLPVLTWPNPVLDSLERQMLVPLFADIIVELGATGHEAEILGRFRGDARYTELFRSSFPEEKDPISFDTITRAVASFERTLVSGDSPFDRSFFREDASAMSAAAQRGMLLFNSHRVGCYHCHEGFNYTSALRTAQGESWKNSFFNTGLYNVDGVGGYPPDNPGLIEITERPEDMGKFRVPTLRNVAVTAPYMHDGSIATLSDVIDHYAAGGRTIASGPHAGIGSKSPLKDSQIAPFQITAEEKADLIAFLESLTDDAFLTNPKFASPF